MIMSPWARISPSPWPIFISFGLGFIFLKMSLWFWGNSGFMLGFMVIMVAVTTTFWLRDLMREGMYKGFFTSRAGAGLKWAVLMFILSEAMFFFSFFWAYGHSSLAPSLELGCVWPPYGISPIHPSALPLFNMGVLVWSSCTLNLATGLMRVGSFNEAFYWALFTVFLGFCFLIAQWVEYSSSRYTIGDSVFGSTFFMLTGFHGFHVLLGLSMIFFNMCRLFMEHYHSGVNLCWMGGVWYWHFVDLIWIGIWFWIYCWGGWGFYNYV